jgi:antitoxin component YwqK of YwqJK toxin-antitoxin module
MENNSLCESDEIYQQNYKNEKQNGPYKEYYDDGKLKLETTLNEGLYEGFCKYYWESGQLREECFYTILDIDGVKESFLEGPCIKWGALDNKTKEFSYIIIDREEGIKESVYHGEYKEYNYSGELHIFCNYNKGVREGKYILFSFMGYKQQECFYINDKLDGLYEEWFIPLGYRRDEKSDNQYKLKKRLYYKNGEYEGSYEYWYNNGNKRVECFYKNKQLDGPFKEWDNRGNLTFEEI